MMDILNIRLKNVYKEFCSYKLTPPTANAKWEDKDISFPGVFLGKFNTNKDFMIINHRAFLLAKFFWVQIR